MEIFILLWMIQADKPLEIIYTSTSYRTGTDTNAHVKTNVAKVEKNSLFIHKSPAWLYIYMLHTTLVYAFTLTIHWKFSLFAGGDFLSIISTIKKNISIISCFETFKAF